MNESKFFNTIFEKENLTNVYLKYIHFTPSTGVDGINANEKYNYESEIALIIRKVHTRTYKFSKYKEKLISKGADKYPRVISIPPCVRIVVASNI